MADWFHIATPNCGDGVSGDVTRMLPYLPLLGQPAVKFKILPLATLEILRKSRA